MRDDLAAEIAKEDFWYHTIELPGGIRTPGLFDMPRALSQVRLPDSLSGKRCLDMGTAEGFWAFEMERRGASEVIAMDLGEWSLVDWPPAYGPPPERKMEVVPRFKLAREALGSSVEWVAGSVYDLRPEVHGEFDFVFLGSLLVHLRDPVGALIALRSVLRGELLVNDVVSLPLSLLSPRWPVAGLAKAEQPAWWIPNVAALRLLAEAAGYRVLASGGPYLLRYGAGRESDPMQAQGATTRPSLRELPLALIRTAKDRIGVPHAWLLASPRPDLTSAAHASDQTGCVAAQVQS
ncbi:MAG: class I SAM-dependent methyltransferase [Solirubrobacteraceae bacterium]